MSEYDLLIHSTYTEMTDNELDSIISGIHKEFPMCGNKQAVTCSPGVFVFSSIEYESQCAELIRKGTMARHLNVIHRRCYSVPAPRSLYHIDDNHKLIRYLI